MQRMRRMKGQTDNFWELQRLQQFFDTARSWLRAVSNTSIDADRADPPNPLIRVDWWPPSIGCLDRRFRSARTLA
jgi:hypothetical protein